MKADERTSTRDQTASRTGRWADLANPTRFLALADRLVPWMAGASAVILAIGLYLGFTAPEDYQQGITVRIMYIHVPFAWLSMMCYSLMAVSRSGHAGLAPPAGRRRAEIRRADRRGLHRAGADYRLDLGQADVGHLVGVGRAG